MGRERERVPLFVEDADCNAALASGEADGMPIPQPSLHQPKSTNYYAMQPYSNLGYLYFPEF